MNKFYVTLLTSCVATVAIAAITLSPNTNNGSGNIPGTYDDLIFNLANGNWVRNLTLPKTAAQGAKITINSSAGYSSILDTSNTDYPTSSLTIKSGDSFSFIFDSAKAIWNIIPSLQFSPKTNADTIPPFTGSLAQYQITDTDWATDIKLPATASTNQIIIIKSDATKTATINTTNVLFPSTYILEKGDKYTFQYNADLKQWLPLSTPTRIVNVANSAQVTTALSNLTAPKTEVKFANAAWISNLTLPPSANDRDRIIVTSTAAWQATIDNTNTNTSATLKLNTGDRYEFIYVADKAHWVLMSSPKPVVNANEVATKLATLKTPVTAINADNAAWASIVALPVVAQTGDKIVVSSLADSNFTVTATGLVHTIHKGDTARFIYENGTWKIDTVQIDILLVNSPEVDTVIGAVAAKLKMRDGIQRTNRGLEKSNAKAYFREVSYLSYKIPGEQIGNALSNGRSDVTVQTELTRVAADATYYQGTQPQTGGCGLAYVNSTPSKFSMIAVHPLGCPGDVMPHELGHNMGLKHSFSRATDEAQREADIAAGIPRAPLDYNYGFEHPIIGTFMSYKYAIEDLDYYSSPKLYDPKYGIRVGEDNKVDAVRKINDNVVAISNFRAAVN